MLKCKMVQYLHIAYIHSFIYFQSFLNYVQYLIQHKCYVNRYEYNVNAMQILTGALENLSFPFWDFFFFRIFSIHIGFSDMELTQSPLLFQEMAFKVPCNPPLSKKARKLFFFFLERPYNSNTQLTFQITVLVPLVFY